jgi:hypothetical protein
MHVQFERKHDVAIGRPVDSPAKLARVVQFLPRFAVGPFGGKPQPAAQTLRDFGAEVGGYLLFLRS